MDIDISRWILEFILWQPLEDTILNALFDILPLPNDNARLKEAVILRRIESEISNGSVSEKILEFLEVIEELYTQEGIEASEALKAAYCAVAVDCTVKCLISEGEEGGKLKYLEAVKRIWKQRINKMEKVEKVGVVSGELWKWRDEIEEALWDARCSDKLITRSRSIAAVDAVKVFVKEAKERIGPPFLKVMAETLGHGSVKACLGLENKEKCGEIHDLTCNNHDREANKGSSLPRRKICLGGEVQDFTCNNHDTEVNKGSALPRRKHGAVKRTRGTSAGLCRGVKIVDSAEPGVGASCEHDDSLSTAKVVAAQEALKSSILELRAVVTDPLPEALKRAETLTSLGTSSNAQQPTENDIGRPPHVVVIDDSAQQPAENGNGTAPDTAVNDNGEVRGNGGGEGSQRNCVRNAASKPGLMAGNSTAHTVEWDDSVDDLTEGSSCCGRRPTLRTPTMPTVSPLKKYVYKKTQMRRKRRTWSAVEEDTLRAGVQEYGVGKWTRIAEAYREIFEDRTPSDLRDKWRNLIA